RPRAAIGMLPANACDPFAVRQRTLDQVRAEELLHRRKAIEPQRMGEADERGWLHACIARERRDRLERKVVRALERHFGDAPELARQTDIALAAGRAELVVGGEARCGNRLPKLLPRRAVVE